MYATMAVKDSKYSALEINHQITERRLEAAKNDNIVLAAKLEKSERDNRDLQMLIVNFGIKSELDGDKENET
jgi:hypothetical protein